MSFKYLITDLQQITGASIHGDYASPIFVEEIIIDSRKFLTGNSTMFVALKTKSNDGHNYISSLYNRGMRCFMVEKLPQEEWPDAVFLKVENSVFALQKMAAYHRCRFSYPLIAITGSNGKTIVKEWLFQVLNSDFVIVRSPKSYNSQIGVPLSVFPMSDEAQLGIFEAGISQPDEMDKLEQILRPDMGIFTNIGHAHDENFIDNRQKINEKIQLFKHCHTLVFCHDHGLISSRLLSVESFREKKLVSWSRKNRETDLFVERIDNQDNIFRCFYKNTEFELALPFSDEASIENAFHVLLASLELGIEPKVLAERISRLTLIAMRLELKAGINKCTLINDVYNSDLNSILIAIDSLAQQKQNSRHAIILSDIMQSGMNENTLYARVADWVEQRGIDYFVGVGKALKRQQHLFKGEKYFYDSTEDFLQHHPIFSFNDQAILLKGARAFEFERISTVLQEKTHQTIMEVNLTALVNNLKQIKSTLKPETKLMAMVKAFSYGSGSFEIANILRYHQVDYLAVAYADEGVQLRKGGIDLPIMVMNPDARAYEMMIVNNLEPEIYSIGMLKAFIQAAEQIHYLDQKPIGVHLKLETGMHRLGVEEKDFLELVDLIGNHKYLEVKSLFSHMVASDAPEFDDFTREQVEKFQRYANFLEKELGYEVIRHMANSSGICRFPEYQLDMVRLGIGMYGFTPCAALQDKLQNVMSIKSIVSQVKTINAGESVGYNRAFIAEKETQIATVPVGYADGFNRKFSQGKGHMFVQGQAVPVMGNVCMDMTMLDISGLEVKEGDEVVVMNENWNAADWAKVLETIPYDVLTSISGRVKRVYIQE